MGVNTFLLDRRTAVLVIGGSRQTVGTLRSFFKLTELDLGEGRVAELEAAARITPSPTAAMIMGLTELPLADKPGKPVAAHLVLGWDEGRGSVTDFGWDYLPQLGYAVRNAATRRSSRPRRDGRAAGEALRSVKAAQLMYLADNPSTAVAALTQASLLPYMPNGTWPTLPTVGTVVPTINCAVFPPVALLGTTTYDPSGSATDGLWDVGQY